MKKQCTVLGMIVALGITAPALAMEVSNLDRVDHRVLFEAAGARDVRVIPAGSTEYYIGQPNGVLTLLSTAHPKKSGAVNSDGVLSGYIGNGRNQGVPVDGDYTYVIWPGGELGLQGRRFHSSYH